MVKEREAWHVVVHGVTESWTQLSNGITTKEVTTSQHGIHLVLQDTCFLKAYPHLVE